MALIEKPMTKDIQQIGLIVSCQPVLIIVQWINPDIVAAMAQAAVNAVPSQYVLKELII